MPPEFGDGIHSHTDSRFYIPFIKLVKAIGRIICTVGKYLENVTFLAAGRNKRFKLSSVVNFLGRNLDTENMDLSRRRCDMDLQPPFPDLPLLSYPIPSVRYLETRTIDGNNNILVRVNILEKGIQIQVHNPSSYLGKMWVLELRDIFRKSLDCALRLTVRYVKNEMKDR